MTQALPYSDSSPSETARYDFAFHGSGAEYFKVWIVNLALTIVTLGVFSAWAKVRTRRYFYGNTEVDGDHFDYLANPVAILKGRLIAVAALVIYTVVQMISSAGSVLIFLVLLGFVPYLAVRAIRFNAAMTAWRAIRFGFEGTQRGALAAYIGWPLLGLFTLGFGLPYAWYKQNHFIFDHYRFGRSQGRSSASAGDFYVIALVLGGLMMGTVVVVSVVAAIVIAFSADVEPSAAVVVAIPLLYVTIYVGLYFAYRAMYFNTVYNNIHVADTRVRNSVTVLGWTSVALTNSALILLTLGFYYPWARVRMIRYILAHVWLESPSVDNFAAHELDHTSALGEEVGEAFDLGFGI